MAAEHEFLMHGLLSIAALHTAYLNSDNPEKRASYVEMSSRYEQRGLQLFRHELQNINAENVHAAFAFSMLLILQSWAAPDRPTSLYIGDEEEGAAIGFSALLHGSLVFMKDFQEQLHNGPLRSMFVPWFNIDRQTAVLLPEHEEHISKLSSLWNSTSSAFDHDQAEILEVALKELRNVFAIFTQYASDNTVPDVSAALAWVSCIPDAYAELVHRHNPVALILLAHYCILLKKCDGRWWIEGKAEDILGRIRGLLGPEWHVWLEWPLAEVGI